MSNENKISLVFIVGGEEIAHPTQLKAPLHAALGEVLAKAKVSGRNDPKEWIITDEAGNKLDMTKKVEGLGLKDGDKLYLELDVGGGGH